MCQDGPLQTRRRPTTLLFAFALEPWDKAGLAEANLSEPASQLIFKAFGLAGLLHRHHFRVPSVSRIDQPERVHPSHPSPVDRRRTATRRPTESTPTTHRLACPDCHFNYLLTTTCRAARQWLITVSTNAATCFLKPSCWSLSRLAAAGASSRLDTDGRTAKHHNTFESLRRLDAARTQSIDSVDRLSQVTGSQEHQRDSTTNDRSRRTAHHESSWRHAAEQAHPVCSGLVGPLGPKPPYKRKWPPWPLAAGLRAQQPAKLVLPAVCEPKPASVQHVRPDQVASGKVQPALPAQRTPSTG